MLTKYTVLRNPDQSVIHFFNLSTGEETSYDVGHSFSKWAVDEPQGAVSFCLNIWRIMHRIMKNSITTKNCLLSAFLLSLTACSNGNKTEGAAADVAKAAPATQMPVPMVAKYPEPGNTPTAEESVYLTKAYNYLASALVSYGVSQPQSQLLFIKMVKEQDFTHVYLQQVYRSVPVFQNRLIVHFDKDDVIYRVTGSGLPVPDETVVIPALSEYDINSAAIDVMPATANWQVKRSLLVLYCKNKDANLAYHVELHSGLQRQFVLLDALDGRLIKHLQGSPSRL